MTTVLLDYSSSGPTLEHQSHEDDILPDGKGIDVMKISTVPKVAVESGANPVTSPEKEPVEPSEMISEESGDDEEQEIELNSQSSTSEVSLDIQPSSTPDGVVTATPPRPSQVSQTPPTPSLATPPQAHSTHNRSPSETSSLHVEVDALLPSVSVSVENSPSHSLTDVSTNSSYSELSSPTSPPTLLRLAGNKCTAAETITAPSSKPVLKREKGEETEAVEHSNDGEHLAAQTSEPQSVALHSSSGGNLTSVMTGATHTHTDTEIDGGKTGSVPRSTPKDSGSIELPSHHVDLPSTSSQSAPNKPPAPGLPGDNQLMPQPLAHPSR